MKTLICIVLFLLVSLALSAQSLVELAGKYTLKDKVRNNELFYSSTNTSILKRHFEGILNEKEFWQFDSTFRMTKLSIQVDSSFTLTELTFDFNSKPTKLKPLTTFGMVKILERHLFLITDQPNGLISFPMKDESARIKILECKRLGNTFELKSKEKDYETFKRE